MSPARKNVDVEEPDRVEGQPHPREVYELIGQDDALARAARVVRSGRPPHGLMLTGPAGIGKATLAYRIARYVLRFGATAEGPESLSVPQTDIVSRQIEAQAHPGLLVLKRPVDEKTGRLKTVVSVHEIRRLGGFFGLTSAAGGWRVAIIDTADDMNDNAANALLKALEEPPRALAADPHQSCTRASVADDPFALPASRHEAARRRGADRGARATSARRRTQRIARHWFVWPKDRWAWHFGLRKKRASISPTARSHFWRLVRPTSKRCSRLPSAWGARRTA